MSDDHDNSSNVVPFAPPSASLRVDRALRVSGECEHLNVEISQRPRQLSCKDCGSKNVDPYDYILFLAESWERVFPKNEAARKLETALGAILAARGSITINSDGVTARRLTEHGQKLEAHESWGMHGFHGGAAGAIVAAVQKLEADAARWGTGEVVYPRWTIEKIRGEQRWIVGVMRDRSGWESISEEPTSVKAAYDLVASEAAKIGKPLIVEQRPRRLWR